MVETALIIKADNAIMVKCFVGTTAIFSVQQDFLQNSNREFLLDLECGSTPEIFIPTLSSPGLFLGSTRA
jgi:hypothetical protein